MESSLYNLQNILTGFAILCFFYAIALGALFLLVKLISQAAPTPYTFKAFLLLCIPGFLYCFLVSASDKQGWNFLNVLFCLLMVAFIEILRIRKISMKTYLFVGCGLALILWLAVPKSVMRMF